MNQMTRPQANQPANPTASLLEQLADHRHPSTIEIEAYARRLRAQAIADLARAGFAALKQALAAKPAVEEQPWERPLSFAEIEADVRFQRAEAIAEVIYQISHLIGTGARKLFAWLQYGSPRQAAMAELYGMPDRDLKDMGLCRGDIPAAVDGQVYRPVHPVTAVAKADPAANENAGAVVAKQVKETVGERVVA
ncbi:RSP_7527 family protein [Ferrovibrio sp.]|uniref:RSP_7527 family protein n=1 Tax=Ferrovibrio sp. TaxID=1917215 RepID=UPI0025B935B8|nr:DUF1127 domain-containing protein [Ferrovibrio sp.]MBX3455769.1 DUF1127 domain-containing protein [Ferrovibrio sp.]